MVSRKRRKRPELDRAKARRLALTALSLTAAGMFVFGLGFGSGIASPPPPPAPPKTMAEQIAEDVQQALKLNAQAHSNEEWQTSGFTPADIFRNVDDLKSLEAAQALCRALVGLRDVDLALFEESIDRSKLECRPALRERLAKHWRQAELDMRADKIAGPGTGAPPVVPVLPNVERELDAAAGPELYSGDLKPGEICLTFDDGPHATRTAKILAILEQAGVRANYFEVGVGASAHPELSRLVAEHGHIVGSHTHDHQLLTRLDMARATKEIESGASEVAMAAGDTVPFFRFPYGGKNTALRELVKSKGWASFLWNMDPQDWKLRDPRQLFQSVLRELNREKRGIILFHDIQEQTTIVLPYVLAELKERGFTTVVFVPKVLP